MNLNDYLKRPETDAKTNATEGASTKGGWWDKGNEINPNASPPYRMFGGVVQEDVCPWCASERRLAQNLSGPEMPTEAELIASGKIITSFCGVCWMPSLLDVANRRWLRMTTREVARGMAESRVMYDAIKYAVVQSKLAYDAGRFTFTEEAVEHLRREKAGDFDK